MCIEHGQTVHDPYTEMGARSYLSLYRTMLTRRHHPLVQVFQVDPSTSPKLCSCYAGTYDHVSLLFSSIVSGADYACSGLSFWQVYTGMREEWPEVSGYEVPMGYCVFWKVWVIVIPILYLFGLALLPRQYRKEKEQRENGCATVEFG